MSFAKQNSRLITFIAAVLLLTVFAFWQSAGVSASDDTGTADPAGTVARVEAVRFSDDLARLYARQYGNWAPPAAAAPLTYADALPSLYARQYGNWTPAAAVEPTMAYADALPSLYARQYGNWAPASAAEPAGASSDALPELYARQYGGWDG